MSKMSSIIWWRDYLCPPTDWDWVLNDCWLLEEDPPPWFWFCTWVWFSHWPWPWTITWLWSVLSSWFCFSLGLDILTLVLVCTYLVLSLVLTWACARTGEGGGLLNWSLGRVNSDVVLGCKQFHNCTWSNVDNNSHLVEIVFLRALTIHKVPPVTSLERKQIHLNIL